MKYLKIISIIFVFGVISSCSKRLDELLVNPNGPTPDAADVNAFLNQAQLSFSAFFSNASDFGSALSRQQALVNGYLYSNSYTAQSYDGMWTNAYTGVIKHVDALIPIAESQTKYQQLGIAKILKAYTMITLVDDFGSVPFSEADLGVDNINPKADDGQSIYDAMLALIDDAISDLNQTQDSKTKLTTDLFFNGDNSKWIALGNTLKLKILVQQRLVNSGVASQIAALEDDGNLIYSSSQDFQFSYGKNTSSPDTRHPHYTANYLGGGANDYISNDFMFRMLAKKSGGAVSSLDPRRRYYFYRQVGDYSKADQTTCPCVNQPRPSWYPDYMPYCLPELSLDGSGIGYWGRDHGDASGVGPDNYDRTAWGVYPCGGQFDQSLFTSLSSTGLGGGGRGIDPIWLSSFTYFLEAEAALTLGVDNAGDARSLLESGIRASISKVLGFPAAIGYTITSDTNYNRNTPYKINTYVNTVLANYDAAETDDERLDIIMEEYMIALWGNGVEPYNNLRRTGKPSDLQYMVTTPSPGFFIRSFYYPSVYVNNNANAPAQKTSPDNGVTKIFWDNNPDDFIK